MKRKLLLLVSSFFVAIGLVFWRTHILGTYVENFNGFFFNEYNLIRAMYAIVLIAIVVFVCIAVFTDKQFPGSPRRSSKTLGLLNLAYCVVLFINAMTLSKFAEETYDYIYILLVFALFGYMIYYAVCLFTFKKVNALISTIPLIVFVLKLADYFIESFGVVKTSEITINIVALSFCVIFFLYYARYVAKLHFRKVRKNTVAAGVLAYMFCLIAVVPDMIAPLFYAKVESRLEVTETLFMLATATYIMGFLVISLCKPALYAHRHKKEEYVSDPYYANEEE
ncbi:MAG: hypothetical protein IIU65_03170 [Clostridia bacterium]|nr:hypothetical protein [Clostridia bacterium]